MQKDPKKLSVAIYLCTRHEYFLGVRGSDGTPLLTVLFKEGSGISEVCSQNLGGVCDGRLEMARNNEVKEQSGDRYADHHAAA